MYDTCSLCMHISYMYNVQVYCDIQYMYMYSTCNCADYFNDISLVR